MEVCGQGGKKPLPISSTLVLDPSSRIVYAQSFTRSSRLHELSHQKPNMKNIKKTQINVKKESTIYPLNIRLSAESSKFYRWVCEEFFL